DNIPANPAGPPTEEPTSGGSDLFFLRHSRGAKAPSPLPHMKIPKDAFGPRKTPENLERTTINSEVFPQPEVTKDASQTFAGKATLPRLGDLQNVIPRLEADQDSIKTLEAQ